MLMETYRDISIYDANNYFLLIGRTKSAEFYKLLKIKKHSNSLEIQEVNLFIVTKKLKVAILRGKAIYKVIS